MTLSELIRKFRVAAFDMEQPYLFSDEDITDWLNDAEKEAAIRGRLIHDCTNPDVCVIPVLPNVAVYPLHKVYEIEHIGLHRSLVEPDYRPETLYQVSQEDVAGLHSDWRTSTGTPEYVIQYDQSIRLVPMPRDSGFIKLEGYRVPLAPMVLGTDEPEINPIHHEYLIYWALHKAFSVPDAEVLDPNRAAIAEGQFTDYFGIRPDSDLRRITRHDVPHTVKPFWV